MRRAVWEVTDRVAGTVVGVGIGLAATVIGGPRAALTLAAVLLTIGAAGRVAQYWPRSGSR